MRFTSTSLLFALTSIALVRADVRLTAIFGDHMVLPRNQKVPVGIHPKDKLNVGLRLGIAARHVAYVRTDNWANPAPAGKALIFG